MERSEKDLEKMCRRLVRFEESRIRTDNPDVSLKLEIRKDRDGWCGDIIMRKSRTGFCYHRFRRYAESLEWLLVEFIYSISYNYSLLDLHLSDSYDTILEPGALEELDLKLSSMGF